MKFHPRQTENSVRYAYISVRAKLPAEQVRTSTFYPCPPNHMQRLAYKLCHLYYNWPVGIIALCFFVITGLCQVGNVHFKMPHRAYLAFQRNLVVEIFVRQFGTFWYTSAPPLELNVAISEL